MSKENHDNKQETHSIHLRIKEDLLKEIDVFTKEMHFSNRTDSMRFLLAFGLKYQELTHNLLKKGLVNLPTDYE